MGVIRGVLLLWAIAVAGAAAADAPFPGLVELTGGDFQATLQKLGADYDWVLAEFYAHWCPACRAFQPTYEQVAKLIEARGHDAAPRVAVARLDCANFGDLCARFDINGYPTMFLGKAAQLQGMSSDGLARIDPGNRSVDAVIKALEKQLGSSLAAGGAEGAAGNQPQKPAHLQIVKPRGPPTHADLGDIEGATIKSWQFLMSSAALRGDAARQALEMWVRLLAESHPVERCRAGAAAAATRLSALWPAGAEAPADQGGLAALPVCAPQAFTEWGGCRGSSPNTRGYTCGLWQLLHALAAQLPDAPGAGAAWLAAVAGWGKHFFQCSECSAHFTAHATATAATAVASKREAVLWVWRTHNLVNERLVGEDADSGGGDPEFPHVQWPTPAECAQCRRAKGDWDEDAVYGFLQRYYGVVGEAGAARLKAASRRGGWGDAALVCAAVAAAVYGVLRNSGQYALRKSGSRLL